MNNRQALSSEKRLFNPKREPNPQPSDDQLDAPTNELARPRWGSKVQVGHMCDLSGSHYINNDIDEINIFRSVRAWRYLQMIASQFLSQLRVLGHATRGKASC